MSTIRVIYYGGECNFPATDQHPLAWRYFTWADGRITSEIDESEIEKADIDAIATAAQIAVVGAGNAQRAAEALQRDEDEADDAFQRCRATAFEFAAQKALSAGQLGALVMEDEQRRFMRRIEGAARARFIDATAKERRQMMKDHEAPTTVLDVIDGPPTQHEITEFINRSV